ncbi:hypothetical protein Cni_G19575 [Canna indica]|uniref:Uncharacterized protein n=1 Tax=Canna indica TaxID=4628 RepID=A0AAQ3QIN1_9LILI|nr:hypothetical protein Cni_G19573 [Canna indica]WOL10816.1 hypothetical protein Cni_G19575 [Canna indica]
MLRAGAPADQSVVVGEAEEAMRGFQGVSMMVVDFRRRDARRVLREARPGPRGMVVVCKGRRGQVREAAAIAVFGVGTRVVRSTYRTIGD